MTAVAPTPTRARARSPYRLSFAHLLHSEWIKIFSVRSTWWSLAVAAVLSVGISMMIAGASAGIPGGIPAVSAILLPMQFTMLVAGILGAIVVTGEYSTGMIRSSLTAEPRRGAVLASKAIVVALVVGVTAVVIYGLAILATAPLLSAGVNWSDPDQSLVPLAFGVLSMMTFALIGVGFGFLVRNGAGAIAATVGVLFVLPIILSLFTFAGESWHWIVELGKYLPSTAASALATPGNDDLLPSVLALAGWVIVPLLLGWLMLRTRDA